MYKFWSLAVQSAEQRSDLYILDEIAAQESWWSDAVTPQAFKRELDAAAGTLYVWLDSPGGDAFAGATIYDMLREYSASGRGKVVAMVSLAASAASIIAMAADEIRISVLGTIMIHEPWSRPTGKAAVLRAVADTLDTVRDGQVNAYVRRTGQSREKILELLNGPDGNGTYLNAAQALELGFADVIMHDDAAADPAAALRSAVPMRVASCIERVSARLESIEASTPAPAAEPTAKDGSLTAVASAVNLSGVVHNAPLDQLLAAIRAATAGAALSGDLMDAVTAGIRAGLARWDAIRAKAGEPSGASGAPSDGLPDGPEEDPAPDYSLTALLSAIESTKDLEL